MKGFFKFIGILVIIGFIFDVMTDDKKNNTKIEPTTTPQQIHDKLVNQPTAKSVQSVQRTRTLQPKQQVKEKDTNAVVANGEETESQPVAQKEEKEDKRLFRYKQCEEIHSQDYCRCLLGHVEKKLGMFEEAIWLEGGALTSAEGRKALAEAEILCEDIDREYWAKKLEERKKEEAIAQKKWEEKEQDLLNYKNDFCSIDSFRQLMDSHNKYKKDQVEFPIDNIELVDLSEGKFCKIDFRCTWCGKDNITTTLFFKRTPAGKLEFDVNQGTDATHTLYFIAVWINNAETVKDLIDKGADVNYKYKENKDSFFTRMVGIGETYFDVVKTCVENGANIHDQYTIEDNFSATIYKETPLTKAVNVNDQKSAFLLLQKGVNPNIPQIVIYEDGRTSETYPLERTILFSDPTMSKKLIEHGATIPEYGYVDGEKMPLIWAVILGNPENLIERLTVWLSHGADANAEHRLTKSIMIHGADGKFKRIGPEYRSQKPIEYAENNKMLDVVQLLQKYGAKPKHEIADLRWCNTEYGKQICGTFINNTESTLKTVYITFNLYDSDNARVGEAMAYSTNIGPQEKWKFKTTAEIGSDVKSYKIQEIANYDF